MTVKRKRQQGPVLNESLFYYTHNPAEPLGLIQQL